MQFFHIVNSLQGQQALAKYQEPINSQMTKACSIEFIRYGTVLFTRHQSTRRCQAFSKLFLTGHQDIQVPNWIAKNYPAMLIKWLLCEKCFEVQNQDSQTPFFIITPRNFWPNFWKIHQIYNNFYQYSINLLKDNIFSSKSSSKFQLIEF